MPNTNKYTVNKMIVSVDYIWGDQEERPSIEESEKDKRKPVCIVGHNGLLVKDFDNKEYKRIIEKGSEKILLTFYVKKIDLEKIKKALEAHFKWTTENTFDTSGFLNMIQASDRMKNFVSFDCFETMLQSEHIINKEVTKDVLEPTTSTADVETKTVRFSEEILVEKPDETTSLLDKNPSIKESESPVYSKVNEKIAFIERYARRLSSNKDQLAQEKATHLTRIVREVRGLIGSCSEEKRDSFQANTVHSLETLSQYRNSFAKTLFWCCCSFFRPKPTSERLVMDMLKSLGTLQLPEPQDLSSASASTASLRS